MRTVMAVTASPSASLLDLMLQRGYPTRLAITFDIMGTHGQVHRSARLS